jgi:hypothetical protein
MEMPPMQHHADMPMGEPLHTMDDMPMDPNAEPQVPELPPAVDHHSPHNVEDPNMPTENVTETFKKYGNKNTKGHMEGRAARCKHCGAVVDSEDMVNGMCDTCYNHGGDDE